MKKAIKNILIPAAVLAIVALSMSSCQRGYGCPYKMTAKAEAKK